MSWIAAHLLMSLLVAGDKPPAGEVVQLKHCEITYDRTTTLGAFVLVQAGGRVQDCYVKPGDRVKAGQVLARLHDRDAVIELARMKALAESDVDIRLAEAKLAVAQGRLKRHDTLNQKKLSSVEEMEVTRLEVKSYMMEIEQAHQRRRNDELASRRMEAEVRSRELVAPHDGVVVEILKNVGESCICNEGVLKMVADDRVKATGFLDVGDTWRVRVGQRVKMVVEIEGAEMAIEHEVFLGRVVFVDPRIDPLNRTCPIVAEVENRDHLLRAGLQASMEIDLTPSAEAEHAVMREVAPPSKPEAPGPALPGS